MIKKLYFNNKKIFKIGALVLVVLIFFVIYFYSVGNKMTIDNTESTNAQVSSESSGNTVEKEDISIPLNNIIGQRCDNGSKRPYAVMMAADKVARPLSGISKADLVVEMPVITDGITRYMALFQCEEPKEIGSIRSARHDFITLAESFDAIYAHWGGSHFALEKLNAGVMDNIDALVNPHNTFFRKSNIAAPHNGFTSFENLKNTSDKLNYRKDSKFEGYIHTEDKSSTDQRYEISIKYPYPYNVDFLYNPKDNSYFRSVGGFKDVDRLTNTQVTVKNLVVLEAYSEQIEEQYNDVEIETSGSATVYRNGEIIRGSWERKDKKYYFYDNKKKEVAFVPGKIWISIMQSDQNVSIKNL